MATQLTSPAPSSRWPRLIGPAGCLALMLCLTVVIGAGAWWYTQGRARQTGPEPAVEYILDASPRMSEPAEGGTRLAVAQAVLAEVVRPANPELTAGLRVFGAGSQSEACRDTSLIVPLAPANQLRIADELGGVQASASADAALAEAMVSAISDLAGMAGPHSLVVVTGGADACTPEAGELIAAEAARAGMDLQVFVVGYLVSATEAEAIRGLVEDLPGGIYLDALSEDELRALLEDIQAHVDAPSTDTLAGVIAHGTPLAATAGPAATLVAASTPQGVSSPTAEPTPEPAAPTTTPDVYAAQTACDHPYWPLREGATWTFENDFGRYTLTVVTVTGDLNEAEATLRMDSAAGGNYTWTARCGTEGVALHDSGILVDLGSEEENGRMEGESVSGVTLPPLLELLPGATWSHVYTIQYADDNDSGTGEASESYTADGFEDVAAGSEAVEALRIDTSGEYHDHPDTPSAGDLLDWNMTISMWYAYGVGPVRRESSIRPGDLTVTTVLVDYDIPE